jgi:CDP-glucose 4,6-dehydratase
VLEPLAGYLTLAEALWERGDPFDEAWNFGPRDEDARSVEWIVKRMVEQWGKGADWTRDTELHPHEANYLKLDITKARAMLGWRPRWTLEDALQRIVDWQKAWLAGADMRAYCLLEISDYNKANPA